MTIVIEFYRTRQQDGAHAVIAREIREAVDLNDAIRIAQALSQTREMPQRPDAMTITDADGNKLYSGVVGPADAMEGGHQ